MGIINALLLIVMGLIAARAFLGAKVPAIKSVLDPLTAQAEYIGIGGLLIGFIWFLQAMSALSAFGTYPMLVLEMLIGCLLMMLLGLMLSLPLLHKFMNEPTPGFLLKADKMVASLEPQTNNLGLAAIVVGVLCLF